MHPYRVAAFALLAFVLSFASDVRAGTLPVPPITAGTDWAFERFVRVAAGGAADIVDSHAVDIGGKVVKMQGTRGLTASAVARAAARGAAGGAAGVAISLAAAAAWCKATTDSFTCDERQDQVPVPTGMWGFCGYTTACYTYGSLPEAFIGRHPPPYAPGYMTPQITNTVAGTPVPTCIIAGTSYTNCTSYTVTVRAGPTTSPSTFTENFQTVTTMALKCPAVVDFYDPAYSSVGGPPGSDGKCPTGRQSVPTEEAATLKLLPHITEGNAVQIVNEAKAKVDLAPLAAPQIASGPASLGGTSKVTTRTTPLGDPVSVLEWTETNLTYGGNTYTTTKTTTKTTTDVGTGEVIDVDTTTETTETTETGPGMCDLYPNVVACAKIDTVEVDPIPTVERPVTYAPAAGFGADSASCPADVSASFLGQAITWSYAPMCQFAGGIRFVVIALASLIGGMLVMGAARSGD